MSLDFVRFMTQHTGETLATVVIKIFKIWKSTNKVLCVTTDNGADVVKGMRLLRCKLMR